METLTDSLPTQELYPAGSPIVVDLRHPAAESLKQSYRDTRIQLLLDPESIVDTPEGPVTTRMPNYEYAKDAGLLDEFYYDPETGYDALVHILIGDIISEPETGGEEAAGFHHEPSSISSATHVDRSRISQLSKKHRHDYFEYPFEPYRAEVVIKGRPKLMFRRDAKTGEMKTVHGSTMFPKEYDPLAIIKTICYAKDNRDTSKDVSGRNDTIITDGEAPMLDGKSMMKLRLILDRPTGRVITAFPMLPSRPGKMRLAPTEIDEHLGLY